VTLISLIILLIVIGVLLWALSQVPWIEPNIKKLIYIVVVVCVVLWLAHSLLGGSTHFNPRLWMVL
jgi:hypothetical protein